MSAKAERTPRQIQINPDPLLENLVKKMGQAASGGDPARVEEIGADLTILAGVIRTIKELTDKYGVPAPVAIEVLSQAAEEKPQRLLFTLGKASEITGLSPGTIPSYFSKEAFLDIFEEGIHWRWSSKGRRTESKRVITGEGVKLLKSMADTKQKSPHMPVEIAVKLAINRVEGTEQTEAQQLVEYGTGTDKITFFQLIERVVSLRRGEQEIFLWGMQAEVLKRLTHEYLTAETIIEMGSQEPYSLVHHLNGKLKKIGIKIIHRPETGYSLSFVPRETTDKPKDSTTPILEERLIHPRRSPELYKNDAKPKAILALIKQINGQFSYPDEESLVSDIAKVILTDTSHSEKEIKIARQYVSNIRWGFASELERFAAKVGAKTMNDVVRAILERDKVKTVEDIKVKAWGDLYLEITLNYGNLTPQEFIENIIYRGARISKKDGEFASQYINPVSEIVLCGRFLKSGVIGEIYERLSIGQEDLIPEPESSLLSCRQKMAEKRGSVPITNEESEQAQTSIMEVVTQFIDDPSIFETTPEEYQAFWFLFGILRSVGKDSKKINDLLKILSPPRLKVSTDSDGIVSSVKVEQ